MKNVLDRFLEYVSVETTSNEASTNYPSTPGQLELGEGAAGDRPFGCCAG